MTDDEKAHSVLEFLTGALACPDCGRPMTSRTLFYDMRGLPVPGLFCAAGEHNDVIYMLFDGTRIQPHDADSD